MDPNSPALAPPDGVESNFDNPSNGNTLVVSVLSVSLTISSLFLIIRGLAKGVYVKRFQIEDFVIIPAYVFFVAFSVYIYRIAATTGFFVHAWDIRFGDLAGFYHNFFYVTNFYLATMIFLKSAILLEWIRLFVPGKTRNAFFWTCHVVAVLNALYYTANIIVENVSCKPKAYWWDKSLTGHCLNGTVLALTSATVNLAFDIIILILPQKVIWTLNMSKMRRLGVSVVFVIGLLAVVLAALRVSSSVTYIMEADYTYNLAPQALLQTAEMTAGILVFTIPATPKLMANVMKKATSSVEKLISSRRGSSTGGTGSGRFSGRKKSHTSLEQPVEEQGLVDFGRLKSPESKDSLPNGHVNIANPSHVDDAMNAEGGVLPATHLTAAQSFVTDNRDENRKRQHPWIEQSQGV
ncbi:hypothetical protein ONZ43_g1652 [Nemania bipapillata]|uniref:Uncharacterized protein n=1 Tax=Nemania bipapillata TaxID=110536 RepID=A0ACC2J3P5_9PEZI|nr:hypothetical protein ONZ43_g1652 [Nemania bipapillata]